MNADREGPRNLDGIARDLHAHALATVSPRTLAQLRLPRRAPAGKRVRGHAWPLAAACALAALAIGWRLHRPDVASAPAAPAFVAGLPGAAVAGEDGATLALEENPELFEWLASGDAAALAME